VLEVGYSGPITFDIESAETGENIPTAGFTASAGTRIYLAKEKTGFAGAYLLPQVTFTHTVLYEAEEGQPQVGSLLFRDLVAGLKLGYQLQRKDWLMDFWFGTAFFTRNYFDNTYIESNLVINHKEWGIKHLSGIAIGKQF
jgi:hypothetical protein